MAPLIGPLPRANELLEFADLRHYLSCDNPRCGSKDTPPSLQCSQCESAHYCSVDCQRIHWNMMDNPHDKAHGMLCKSLHDKRSEVEATFVMPPHLEAQMKMLVGRSNADTNTKANGFTTTNATGDDSECGICLEADIRQPVVLPNCGHVFCFDCLSKYQGDSALFIQQTKTCPICRTKLSGHVVKETLHDARKCLYIARRLEALGDDHAEELADVYRLVDELVDKILATDPHHLDALMTKAVRFQHSRPLEVIEFYKKLAMLDDAALDERAEWERKMRLQWRGDSMTQHTMDFATFKEREFEKVSDPDLKLILILSDKGPHRFRIFMWELIRTYLIAGMHAEARVRCLMMLQYEHEAQTSHDVTIVDELHCHLSEALYHLGDYHDAICTAHKLKCRDPHKAGLHKLIALPLLAMAEQQQQKTQGTSNDNGSGGGGGKKRGTTRGKKKGSIQKGKENKSRTTTSSNATTAKAPPPVVVVRGYPATIDGAIQVMYMAFIYEAPWDEVNKQANRVLLQELCDKKAAALAAAALATAAAAAAATGTTETTEALSADKV